VSFSRRTDLASEAHRLWNKSEADSDKLEGVRIREDHIKNISVMCVDILDERGAKALSKPIGKYFTIELNERFDRASDIFPEAACIVSQLIRRCGEFSSYKSFLIAALGNPDITPDALGHCAADSIIVTRHLKLSSPDMFSSFSETVLCRPGVLGTSGLESATHISNLCSHLKPDCVIVIDALAGADVSRLCSTIQICNSGIAPGSGVGNNRELISRETLGVPVIAIGMPTVIDASFFSNIDEVQSMFVTSRDIDSRISDAGKLIAYGINLALHKDISIQDIDLLVS